MYPVRRGLAPLALTASLLAAAPALAGQHAPSTRCTPGAITTNAAGHTLVCSSLHVQLQTSATPSTAADGTIPAPSGGTTVRARRSTRAVRCAAGDQVARAGGTLVVLTTTVDRAGLTVQTTATPFICGRDRAWRQVSSPAAGASLLLTSLVVERTDQER